MFSSKFIFLYLFVLRVVPSIYFYDKFLFYTNEIYNIITYYVLSVEFYS